eukprot:scaffold36143_cov31-Tisochrysis_lutea.AAC.7
MSCGVAVPSPKEPGASSRNMSMAHPCASTTRKEVSRSVRVACKGAGVLVEARHPMAPALGGELVTDQS